MGMGIGSMGGVFGAPAAAAKSSTPGHNSGGAKAVDDFNAIMGSTQADRMRAIHFAQIGAKEEDSQKQEAVNKAHKTAPHAVDTGRAGSAVDIKV